MTTWPTLLLSLAVAALFVLVFAPLAIGLAAELELFTDALGGGR